MKRVPRLVWAMGVMLLLPAFSLAAEADQGKGPDHGQAHGHHDHHHGHWEGHHGPGHLMNRLNLTEDQKRQAGELRKRMEAEFTKILTPEQRKTFEEIKQAHHHEHGQAGHEHGQAGAENRSQGHREDLEKKIDRLTKELEEVRRDLHR